MWSLDLPRIEKLLPRGASLGALAIETGTCRGNGTRVLARKFPRVITIELSAELHRLAAIRLARECPNVECRWGDSVRELEKILPGLPEEESIFFFLDAHWSGDQTVPWEKSAWKGYGIDTAHLGSLGTRPSASEQCPLAEELRIINEHCRGRALVLIDDTKNIPASGPGLLNRTFFGEDWSHLSRERILAAVGTRLENFHEFSDPQQWLLSLRAQVE